jgi:hypothetical protein
LRSDHPALAAGDYNDDGIEDVVFGARFAAGPDGRQHAGTAHVIFGSQTPRPSIDLAENQQDVTVLGARPGDNLGFSAAPVPRETWLRIHCSWP